MNHKMFEGQIKASPEKRYKSFLNTVADLQQVWLLGNDEGETTTFDFDGYIHIALWPREEFCYLLKTQEHEKPISMEIHDFLDACMAFDESIRFMVFPTTKDSYIVSTADLCADIMEHLDEVE